MRNVFWDCLIFRGRARKDSANNTKSKKSEREEPNRESVILQKPKRREPSTESNATDT